MFSHGATGAACFHSGRTGCLDGASSEPVVACVDMCTWKDHEYFPKKWGEKNCLSKWYLKLVSYSGSHRSGALN